MLEAIGKIRRYTAGQSLADFAADPKTIDAVIRNFEIIGEAAKHVPPLVGYARAEWSRIGAMRNKLIHDYAAASPVILWQTIQARLDPLEAAVRQRISQLDADEAT